MSVKPLNFIHDSFVLTSALVNNLLKERSKNIGLLTNIVSFLKQFI